MPDQNIEQLRPKPASNETPEDQGLVARIGPVEIDWPKSIGYFGGIGLAVAFEVIEPPLAIFIAAIPFLKLLKQPHQPWPLRIAADVMEGAAKPVGGDSESSVRVADSGGGQSSGQEPRGRTPQSQ